MERFQRHLKNVQASPAGEAWALLKCNDIVYEKYIDAPIGITCIRRWGRHELKRFLSPKRIKAIYRDGADYYVVALVDPNDASPFLAPELPSTAQLIDTPITAPRARCPRCGSFKVVIDADEMFCEHCKFSDFWHVEDVTLYEPPKSPFDLNAVFKAEPEPPKAYLKDLEEEEKRKQLDEWARQKLQELGLSIWGQPAEDMRGYEVLTTNEIEEGRRRLRVGVVVQHICEYDGPCETIPRFYGAAAEEPDRHILYVIDPEIKSEHVRALSVKGAAGAAWRDDLLAMFDTETAMRAIRGLMSQGQYLRAVIVAEKFGLKIKIAKSEAEEAIKKDDWKWLLEAIQEHPAAFEVEPEAMEVLKKRYEEYEEQKRREEEERKQRQERKQKLFEETKRKVEELNKKYKALDIKTNDYIYEIKVETRRYLKREQFDALVAELKKLGFRFEPKRKYWYYIPRV